VPNVQVVVVESLIAAAFVPQAQISSPYSVYNKMDISAVQALTPNLPWKPYLLSINATDITTVNVAEPAFFTGINAVLTQVDLTALSTYLRWNLLHNVANMLPSAFVNETFSFFGVVLNGEAEPQPRSATCVAATDAALGNILGQAFVDIAFPGASQQLINTMISGIETAFQEVLNNLTWMDPTTKTNALLKLSKVTRRVGAPQNPSYYPGYNLVPNSFLGSTLTKQNYDFRNTLLGIGQAPNKNLWQMTADTVNAYYNPLDNSVNFPAGTIAISLTL